MKLLGTISVDFYVTDQLLITYSVFMKNLLEKLKYNGATHQLYMDNEFRLKFAPSLVQPCN